MYFVYEKIIFSYDIIIHTNLYQTGKIVIMSYKKNYKISTLIIFFIFFILFVLFILFFISLNSCTNFQGPSDFNLIKRKNLDNSLFLWPLKSTKITQKFKLSAKKRHLGIDISDKINNPIFASADGYILYCGNDFSGFGKLIIIKSSKWSFFYAHLNNIYVKEKQIIKKGDIIGSVGNTGRSTNPHLHFEIRKYKKPVNPLNFQFIFK